MRSLLTWPGLLRALVQHLRLAVRLLREPRVPVAPKLLLFAAGLYLIMPADFIPDVFLLVGQVDDLAVALVALQVFVYLCPEPAVAFHREAIAQGRRFSRMPGGSREVIDAEWRRED